MAFHPNGTMLAFDGPDNTTSLMHLQGNDERVNSYPGQSGAISPDGTTLVTVESGTVWLWDIQTNQLTRTFDAHIGGIRPVFSPDSSLLAFSGTENDLYFGEPSSGMIQQTLTYNNWVDNVAFSPDGTLLVSVSTSGEADVFVLWNIENEEILKTWPAHDGFTLEVLFNPNGTLLASIGRDRTMRLWGIPPQE